MTGARTDLAARKLPRSHGSQPCRRVILIGASNLSRSLPSAVSAAQAVWDEPLDVMAAIGHGRSFGRQSSVLGRRISGILSCGLWDDLERHPALPTAALVTDIGNDILYGVAPQQLLAWVSKCLKRLARVNARTVVTALPMDALATLGGTRYLLLRSLFFPSCRLSLAAARARADFVNRQLPMIADLQKTTVLPVSNEWYGLDPVHIRRRNYSQVWAQVCASWMDVPYPKVASMNSLWRSTYLRLLPPLHRSILGLQQRRAQPSGRLPDGTTISLY